MRKFKRRANNDADRTYPYMLEYESGKIEMKGYNLNLKPVYLQKSIQEDADSRKPLFKKRYMLNKESDNI